MHLLCIEPRDFVPRSYPSPPGLSSDVYHVGSRYQRQMSLWLLD